MALETLSPAMLPSIAANPFTTPPIMPPTMPGVHAGNSRSLAPPMPPQLPDRQLPIGPAGGVPPALAAAIAAFTQGMAQQRARQVTNPGAPVAPAPAQPQAGRPSGFWQNLLYDTAQQKFGRGLPTPLADRLGWSSAWGQRPLGMQPAPALPNQAAFPTPQSMAAPIGMNPASMAQQSQLEPPASRSANQNIGSQPVY